MQRKTTATIWPGVRPGRTVRPRRLTRRPFAARQSLSCRRLAQGSQEREALRRRPRRPLAEADSCRCETFRSSRTAGTAKQGRKRQRLRPGRDLHDAEPAQLPGRARRFPPNQSGWPMFFAWISSFSREIEFTKCISEKIATARARHTSRRRQIPMLASPRHRARCNRHEARAGIVALVSCCLVRLSSGGLGPPDETALSSPACTQRSICRGTALANSLDPLAFSGDKRDHSKALFSLCSTEHPLQIQNLSIFHATKRAAPTDEKPQRQPHMHQLPRSRCIPRAWRMTCAILRTPTRLVTTPHSLL